MENPSWVKYLTEEVLERKQESYVCASGISVSGVLHVGKLRDVYIANSIHRFLQRNSRKSKLVYFIDDFDRLKKKPKGLPSYFEVHVGKPYSLVPDPCEDHSSFVEHYLSGFIDSLSKLGIEPELIWESERYRDNFYAEEIRTIYDNRKKIVKIVNSIRNAPSRKFDESRLFVTYCPECEKDNPKNKHITNNGLVGLDCNCGYSGFIDILNGSNVKLSWIVNWPARWNTEGTDFEPIGPDHSAPQGAFEVSSVIAREIFGIIPPVISQYEFIKIRGGRKLSSSGVAVSLEDYLEIYEPRIIHYLFSKRPNQSLSIVSGDEVGEIYDRYDRIREVELPSFRRIVSTLNKFCLDTKRTEEELLPESANPQDLESRISKARNWIDNHAKRLVSFKIRTSPGEVKLTSKEYLVLQSIYRDLDSSMSPEKVEERVFRYCKDLGIQPREFFPVLYSIIFGTNRGPRISRVIHDNREKVQPLLRDALRK